MLVLDPRPHGGFRSSPFFCQGVIEVGSYEFLQERRKCCLLRVLQHGTKVSGWGESGKVCTGCELTRQPIQPHGNSFPARKHLEHPHPTPWVLLNTHSKKNCWIQTVLKGNTSDLSGFTLQFYSWNYSSGKIKLLICAPSLENVINMYRWAWPITE